MANRNTDVKLDTPKQDTNDLIGTVEAIVYRAEDTGYTVCRVLLHETKETATVVGTCPAIWEGETLQAAGEWIRHKQHGRQFQASSLTCIVPTSAKGIERYLASGMVKGIGKVMAERLVNAFGNDTLRIIDKESKRLEEVEGIGRVRRQRIRESWNEQRHIRDVMIFLQGHGMGTAQSARIFRQYGNDAIAMITENPYRLCRDIWGIGFKTTDRMALNMGIPPQSPLRARAGIIHVLLTLTEEGHCYCPEAELILKAEELLEIPPEILGEALQHETAAGHLINEEGHIYPATLYDAEIRVASAIAALANTPPSFRPIDAPKAVRWAEGRMKIAFAPTQLRALEMALREKVSVITGGPGVGKTTIIRALVDVFKARRLSICLAAPTGRAAKRMEEATHHEAKTVHRLLGFKPGVQRFERNADNPLDHDVLILDEVSMVDISLMAEFLAAVRPTSHLVLVGDTDQLPSVGPGNVLKDIIESEAVSSSKLQTIFRQTEGSGIVENAHRINRGEDLITAPTGAESDFFFVETEDPEQVVQRMLALVKHRIPEKFGFDPMTEIQVLTPMRRNLLGADNLNEVLQQALNPSGPEVQRFGRAYRQGDRVMQIRNNYEKEVFNGDIGHIAEINTDDQVVTVTFDGRRVSYDTSELDELVLAYACSIHKSQGSEYPAVIILLTTQHFKLLQRNLLYTALTRGRRLACLVGSKKAVYIATRNDEIRLRRTGLRARLHAMRDSRKVPVS